MAVPAGERGEPRPVPRAEKQSSADAGDGGGGLVRRFSANPQTKRESAHYSKKRRQKVMKATTKTVVLAVGLAAIGAASFFSASPAQAISYIDPLAISYIDPLKDISTAINYDELDPYIKLQGVTYGAGSGGSKNFQEYNDITYDGDYNGLSLGLWQDSQPGTKTFDFWANNGNNPVVSLRIGSSDYIGVVSRQVKDKGNNTLAFQWAAIDADAWYNSGSVVAANDPATYILWISTPQLSAQSTSSDPPVDDLNAELATQRAASSSGGGTEGVPAPMPIFLLPALAGFLPKLRRARSVQQSSVEA